MFSVRIIGTIRARVKEEVRLKFSVSVRFTLTAWFKSSVRISVSFQFCETGIGLYL